MPAKFTSDLKGRIVKGIETSMEEANRLMDDDSKTFYVCPGIAPGGFMDFCAGMTMFPAIGADGKTTGTVFVYEVVSDFVVSRNSGGSYSVYAGGECVALGASREAVIDMLTPQCGEQSVAALLNEADSKAGGE